MDDLPIQMRSVPADAVSIEAVGKSNLDEHEREFFDALDTVLGPYLQSQLGSSLSGYELGLEFLDDRTRSETNALTEVTTYSNYIKVRVDVELIDHDARKLSTVDIPMATSLVNNFFQPVAVSKVISFLSSQNIEVERITVVNLDDIAEISATQPPAEISARSGEDSGPNVALIVSMVALAVLVVAVLVAVRYRRMRRRFQLGDGVILSDDDEEGTSAILKKSTVPPSALQQRRLREEREAEESASRSENSSAFEKSVGQFSDYDVDYKDALVVSKKSDPTSPTVHYQLPSAVFSPPANEPFDPYGPRPTSPSELPDDLRLPEIPPSPIWSLAASDTSPQVLTWDERQQWKAFTDEDFAILSESGCPQDEGKSETGENRSY